MALKLWCCIFLAVLLESQHVHAAAEPPTATAFRCLNEESAKCTINRIDLGDLGDSEIVLPDLRNKTTLQIKGGNMSTFGLCDRLGNVKRLQLGSLQLRELCLTYMLREVSAANNNISSVQFLSSSAKYELEHLDLHSNALATLEGFDVLVNLVEVHLEHNALESFNWTVFERMVKLDNENDLNGLISKYDKLLQEVPLPTSSSNPAIPTKNTQYTTFAKSLEDLNTTVTMELRDVAIQLSENERAQRRLSYIMLELKKSIERGRKTTADLQEQLDNLRSDIYKKLKKRN